LKPIIISHRLRGFDKYESSPQGLRAALSAGVNAFEIDTRITADGHILIHHDADIYTGRFAKKIICSYSISDLQKSTATKGAPRLMSLDDIFIILNQKSGAQPLVCIDIKESGYEEKIIAMIKNYPLKKLIIISWLPQALRRINELNPAIRLCFSHYPIKNVFDYYRLAPAIRLCHAFRHPAISLHSGLDEYNRRMVRSDPTIGQDEEHFSRGVLKGVLLRLLADTDGMICADHRLLSQKDINLYREHNISVMVYSIDQERIFNEYVKKCQPDYILTNNPRIAIQL
jgi:glycerophosphoryl diester phosphodiesterase